MPTTTPLRDAGSTASALLKQRDDAGRSVDVIDRDPEEALAKLEPVLQAAPNVGEITPQDMMQLMAQLMAQQTAMQQQIVALMTGQQQPKSNANTAEELAKDKQQRDNTLESWRTEPREPVYLHPDDDEQKIHSVTGLYGARIIRVNGLEFPIIVGEIANVPSSIARLVEYTQRRRPMSGAPQGLPLIADPQRGQFLAGSQNITVGNAGRAGEGRINPDGLPPSPQALGVRYDHNGQ